MKLYNLMVSCCGYEYDIIVKDVVFESGGAIIKATQIGNLHFGLCEVNHENDCYCKCKPREIIVSGGPCILTEYFGIPCNSYCEHNPF